MNLRPKRYSLTDRPIMHYGEFLVIECEVFKPESWAGRTAYVFLDDDDVTMLLKECRDAAARHRTDPDHKPVRWEDIDIPRKKSGLEDLADWLKDKADG